ncbi:MAG: flagella basal body P-ring formation protein FlgA [Bacteriovoracaceae bacterium]|jgi:flagella basal body P-ring formation protein FlgA
MKLTIVLALFVFVSVAHSKECSIESYDKIYYIPTKGAKNHKSLIKDSDCPSSIQSAFISKIYQSSGLLTSKVLNYDSKFKKSGYIVNLIPNRIRVSNLKDSLKEKFNLGSLWSFSKLKFVNKLTTLGLSKEDTLSFGCEFCHTTGEKNISLVIYNPIKNYSKTYWASATVLVSTKVLVPNRSISPSEPQLTPSDFKLKSLSVTRPEKYFTNIEQLVFYKVNKPISANDGLLFTDLVPVNLVSAGTPTKIILRSKTLQVEGTAIPSQSGKFGEVIRLRNPKTKRMITGKVVDFNKVMVDL